LAKVFNVICVDPARAREVWDTVKGYIFHGLARGGGITDFATIEQRIFDGSALLWLSYRKAGYQIKAAAVTTLCRAGSKRFVTIVACGGYRTENWRDCIGAIEDYARAENCGSIVIQGRLGWQRVLPGYEPIATIMERML
jgi:hypothetical protein